jgi:hypothetical protein
MPNVKVEKKPGSFYILGNLLEIIVEIWQFEFFSFQNLANLDHFSHEKILCIGRNLIFQVEFLQKFAN